MKPEDVPESVAERATAGLAEAIDLLTGAQIGEFPRDPDPLLARAAIAAVASVEEVWEMGPHAAQLPEMHFDGADLVSPPFTLTAEQFEAAGWKRRRRLVTDWVDA